MLGPDFGKWSQSDQGGGRLCLINPALNLNSAQSSVGVGGVASVCAHSMFNDMGSRAVGMGSIPPTESAGQNNHDSDLFAILGHEFMNDLISTSSEVHPSSTNTNFVGPGALSFQTLQHPSPSIQQGQGNANGQTDLPAQDIIQGLDDYMSGLTGGDSVGSSN